MKKILSIVFLLFVMNTLCIGQTSNQNPSDALSMRIAMRMKDSLNLSSSQKDSIYLSNLRINEKKLVMRREYSHNQSILTQRIQQVESTRDSLYQAILSPSQYIDYKSKKQLLIRN